MDIRVRIVSLSNGGQVLAGMTPDQESLVIVFRRPLQDGDIKDGEPIPCASTTVADGLLETRLALSSEEAAALIGLFPRKLSSTRFETPTIDPVLVFEEFLDIRIVFRRALEPDDLKDGRPMPRAFARVEDNLLETSIWLNMPAASVLQRKLSCYKIGMPDQEEVSMILREMYLYERGYRKIHWL